jgi:hypothetical protein
LRYHAMSSESEFRKGTMVPNRAGRREDVGLRARERVVEVHAGREEAKMILTSRCELCRFGTRRKERKQKRREKNGGKGQVEPGVI